LLGEHPDIAIVFDPNSLLDLCSQYEGAFGTFVNTRPAVHTALEDLSFAINLLTTVVLVVRVFSVLLEGEDLSPNQLLRHVVGDGTTQTLDALLDNFRRGRGERQSQCIMATSIRIEGSARYESDLLLLQRFLKQFNGIAAVGQHHPQEEPAFRTGPAYTWWEVFLQRFQHRITAQAVCIQDALYLAGQEPSLAVPIGDGLA